MVNDLDFINGITDHDTFTSWNSNIEIAITDVCDVEGSAHAIAGWSVHKDKARQVTELISTCCPQK